MGKIKFANRRKVNLPSSQASTEPRMEPQGEGPHKQRHRAIANARERDRTESVNYAFTVLRSLLPTEPANRKLSKIEILRLATSYIQHLDNVRTALVQGDSHINICARIRKLESPEFNKLFCTFCVTASKSKCANEDTTMITLNCNEHSWIGQVQTLDLATDYENGLLVPQVEEEIEPVTDIRIDDQQIVYAELDKMVFTLTESENEVNASLVDDENFTPHSTLNWNTIELADFNREHENWNYDFTM